MNNTDSQNNDKVKFQSALLIKIVIAIILGIILGLLFQVLPFGEVLGKILMTLSKLFSNFLSFIVPLLVVGLVAPGIGHLGKDAGKLLLITIAIAYAFTLFSGFGTYFVTSLIYPFMLDNATIFQTDAHVENSIAPYFTLDMPPVLSVTSALIFAFVVGFGLAVTKTDKLMDVIDDLRTIINKIIVSVIIPLLPFYILTIFMNITYVGEIGKVLSVFVKIIILIFILTVILLLIFFSVAGIIAKKNPIQLLRKMMPAYLTALGTSSSAATIPVTLEATLSNGVRRSIASFVIPLCATINLSGSMLKIVACAFAIIYTHGMVIEYKVVEEVKPATEITASASINDAGEKSKVNVIEKREVVKRTEITFGVIVAFIFTLAVAMVAAPGVPGGAIVTAQAALVGVLGFSQELYAVMVALYLVMDSFGTATNVTGDGAVAVIIDKIYKHDHHIIEDETEA